MRTGTGWESTPLDAPFSEFSLYSVEALSPDFQNSLWSANTPAQPFLEDVYRSTLGGPLTRVGPRAPLGLLRNNVLEFGGASDDLSHALYIDESSLWPGDTTTEGLPSLYEYAGAGNSEPRLVGVKNVGVPRSVGEGELISNCGTYLGLSLGNSRDIYNAVSASGAKVFFTAAACGPPGPRVEELYARIEASRTVAISEPTSEDCGECVTSGGADAQFRGASLDGSEVFFTTEQHLLLGTTGVGPFLYEYNFAAPAGKKVTLVSGGDPGGARVLGVGRVSEDGSHVYFVAGGILTGANGEGKGPVAGEPNLYVWARECPNGEATCPSPIVRTSFIATLSAAADGGDWSAADGRPMQATPDGRFLVFQSAADLTPDEEGRVEAGQVFEYDAQTGVLVRVSHGQDGYNEDGNSSTYLATIPVQNYVREDTPINRSTELAMSADGSRVFFSSPVGLTPQALNGVQIAADRHGKPVYAQNVYEYHDGQVDLISSGHDIVSTTEESAVELIGTDESGLDVFFLTSDRLVPQDTDVQTDLYDARIDGGFASPAINVSCSGDPCQGPASVLPAAPTTAPAVGEAPVSTAIAAPGKAKVKPKHKKHKKRHAKRRPRHKSRSGRGR
jgi:hypothetical protein